MRRCGDTAGTRSGGPMSSCATRKRRPRSRRCRGPETENGVLSDNNGGVSRVVTVALPLPIRKNFSYRVPGALPVPAPGSRVRVPFGERVLTGIVVAAGGQETAGLRDVLEVLDAEPVCPPELLAAAERVARRFFASTGEVLKSALPARLPAAGAVRYRITRKGALARASGSEFAILDRLRGGEAVRLVALPVEGRQAAIRALEERGWIRAISRYSERRPRPELAYLPARTTSQERARLLRRSRRGLEVLAFLDSLGRPATAPEVRLRTGAGPSVLRSLAARGLVTSFEQLRRPEDDR